MAGKSITTAKIGFKREPRCNKDEEHVDCWVKARNRVDEDGGLLHGIMDATIKQITKKGRKQFLIPSVGMFVKAEATARNKKVREMRQRGIRKGNTTPSSTEILSQLKPHIKKWQKLQTKAGSTLLKNEMLARPSDDRAGITMEYLQQVGSFVVVTELKEAERMGDVWFTCTCGDAEHNAQCVHTQSCLLWQYPTEAAKLMPAKAKLQHNLQNKAKGGRPANIEPVRSFWG